MSLRWRLRFLGVPELSTEGGERAPLRLGLKDAALLTHLAIEGSVASARAAVLLWPASAGPGALNNLHQRLFRLRRKSGARLVEMDERLMLAPDLEPGPWPTRAALEADPNAWDADLLAGFDYDDAPEFAAWLAAQRQAWRERRRDALAALAAAAQSDARIVNALAFAARLIEDDPLSEHNHRRVMRLHHLRGDPAAAVAAFERCERALKDELGLRPGPETLALLRTVERAVATPALVARVPPLAGLMRPPRCIGRDGERRQLAEALGDGGIAVLIGEAGMGKTRLLQDHFAGRADAVHAQARPGDPAVPFGAFARLVRALFATLPQLRAAVAPHELAWVVPEIGEAAPAADPPGRLLAALTRLLGAAQAQGLTTLVFDDLHFADGASIELLRALVDADGLLELRWAFAHRPIETADHDAALLRSLADAPRACWIALTPLDEPALRELLDSLALPDGADAATLAAALHGHSGGNPLYVLETLRAALSAGGVAARLPRPQSIAHLIDRRLARLAEPALALGRVAALAGSDFTPALAEHALGIPALRLADAWTQLEAADVLRGNGFAHDLVRDAMLRATPQAIAAHAHRVIAEFLERRDGEPASLGAHWLAGGEPKRAALAFRSAARRAQQAARPREEAALLQQAADAFDAAGDTEAALEARLDAVPPTLRSEGVSRALELSATLSTAAGEGPLAGRAAAMRAGALAWAGRAAEAEAAGRAALARLPEADSATRFEAARVVAMMCAMQGRPADGFVLLEPWLSRLDELPRLEDRIWFCGAAGNLLLQSDQPGAAIAMARRHAAYAREAGDDLEQLTSLINAASAHVRRGELGEALVAAREGIALAPTGGQADVLVGLARAVLGYALCGLGQFDAGLAELEAAQQQARQGSPGSALQVMAEDVLAQVHGRLGQRSRALQFVAADPDGLSGHRLANRRLVRALLQADGANRQRLLLEALEGAGDGPGVHVRMNALIALAQASEPAGAVERCDSVMALATAKEYHPLAAQAATVRLGAWRCAGRLDRLAATLADAERRVRACGVAQAYWPELMLECALAHEALGQSVPAEACRADALGWARMALARVPAAFRAGFVERQPANVQLRLMLSDLASVIRA